MLPSLNPIPLHPIANTTSPLVYWCFYIPRELVDTRFLAVALCFRLFFWGPDSSEYVGLWRTELNPDGTWERELPMARERKLMSTRTPTSTRCIIRSRLRLLFLHAAGLGQTHVRALARLLLETDRSIARAPPIQYNHGASSSATRALLSLSLASSPSCLVSRFKHRSRNARMPTSTSG